MDLHSSVGRISFSSSFSGFSFKYRQEEVRLGPGPGCCSTRTGHSGHTCTVKMWLLWLDTSWTMIGRKSCNTSVKSWSVQLSVDVYHQSLALLVYRRCSLKLPLIHQSRQKFIWPREIVFKLNICPKPQQNWSPCLKKQNLSSRLRWHGFWLLSKGI